MSVFLQPLQTVTVGSGGASSVSFSSIPQGYTDLILKVSSRSASSGVLDGVYFAINGISSGYSATVLYGNGSSGNGSYRATGLTSGNFGTEDTNGNTSNTFSNIEVYIPNYAGSNYKSWIADVTAEDNSSGNATTRLFAGLLSNTAAITSLTITNDSSTNFVQYSKFSLYGVLRSGI